MDARDALQEDVAALFLRFFQRLHAGSAGPWLGLDLTMSQFKVLLVIDALGPLPMSQLAARLGVSVSTATGLVDRVVEAGLGQRSHDGRDRRVVRVELTDEGRARLYGLRSASRERLGQVLGRLDGEELERCAQVLLALNGAVDREIPPAQINPVAVSVGRAEAES